MENSQTGEQTANPKSSFDHILFDIRALQASPHKYRPLDRYYLSLICHLPDWVLENSRISLFAEWGGEIPETLGPWRGHLTYTPPFQRESLLVVELAGQPFSLRERLRTSLIKRAHFLTVTDRVPRLAAESANRRADGVDLRFVVPQSQTERSTGALLPMVLDSSLTGPVTALEKLQLELLFDNPGPLIAVDGFFAGKRDIKRALLGATRAVDARVVVLSEADDDEKYSPDFLNFLPSPALLGQIVRRASLTLVPDTDNSCSVSIEEVECLGGRVLTLGGDLAPNALLEAMESPAPVEQKAPALDYSSYWKEILSAVKPVAEEERHGRARFAIMSTMFPQKGGPPHSSLDLVLALTEIVDVDVWTDADMLAVHRAKVRAVYGLDSEFSPDNYDGVVYVMGNHPMYKRIFDHMCRHGGTLIQHDAHMIDFLARRFGEKRLGKILSAEVGRELSDEDVSKLVQNPEKLPSPFLQEIVRHANPVIVHSPTAAEIIRNLYGAQAMYFPVAMPYPFDKKDLEHNIRQQSKLTLGIDPVRPCVASFGEVHMLKGAKQCVFVIKELVDWGYDLQFVFVGPVDDSLRGELLQMARNLNIVDHITLVGGVSETKYIQYLQAVDIVLQIRQIPFGQVSGALLDAVSAGMHGVASENLATSIEAPQCIIRVTDKGSPTLYAEQVAALIDSGKYAQRPGPGWEDFVAKHSFARYARKLVSMLLGTNNAWMKGIRND